METMFAGVYHAAWKRGIPASAIDGSPPYVVAWMIVPREQAESNSELIDLAMQRELRRGR